MAVRTVAVIALVFALWWPGSAQGPSRLPPAGLAAIDRDARAGTYGNIDAIVVMRNGQVVFDQRYARDYGAISRGRMGPLGCGEGCTDKSWMHEFNYFHPSWHPYYQGRDVHTLQSVTKSIAATVVAIALGRGEIAALDRPFLPYFKDRDLSRVDSRLHRATLADLLTMRSGIEWHEQDRPLDDTNSTVQLEKSQDWIAYTLSQPMDADPGTKWAYNSGGSQLMSGIIRAATGRLHRRRTPTTGCSSRSASATSTGRRRRPGILIRRAVSISPPRTSRRSAYLYLHDGVWNGKRILPDGWVRNATTRHATAVGGGWDYGYQWWITSRNGLDVWAGRGFGGQFLIVIPARDLVAVVNSWNVFGGRAGNIFDPLVTALLE